MSRVCLSALLLFVVFLSVSAQAHRGKELQSRREQTVFGAEVKIERPVPLPSEVLRLLRADPKVRELCLKKGDADTAIRPEFFVASRSSLAGLRSSALVVTSARNSPCLGGANIEPFWIFYRAPGGYKLGLKTNAINLYVLKTKTNNFNDIRAQEATAVDVLIGVFKFDGEQYKIWRSWREPIHP